MKNYQIKHRYTNSVIFETTANSLKEALEIAVKQGANMQRANLQGADLQYADLQYADLYRANLHRANLQQANIDFSCWPLWCGSTDVIIDEKQARQLLYHAFNVSQKFCKPTDEQKEFINQFHRIKDKSCQKL